MFLSVSSPSTHSKMSALMPPVKKLKTCLPALTTALSSALMGLVRRKSGIDDLDTCPPARRRCGRPEGGTTLPLVSYSTSASSHPFLARISKGMPIPPASSAAPPPAAALIHTTVVIGSLITLDRPLDRM